ncbi:Flp pilus assembly complex ATPase component TadA [Candidatus Micrarchaeota archaeon]|nr:Flp pilus assembly complex ATPase component TadA [Candidatus Micrarchaeota archaeon]
MPKEKKVKDAIKEKIKERLRELAKEEKAAEQKQEEVEETPEQPPAPEQEAEQPGEEVQLGEPVAETEPKVELPEEEEKRKIKVPLLANYSFESEGIPIHVKIIKVGEFVPRYEITMPSVDAWTRKMLESKLRGELVSEVKLDISEILDPKKFEEVKMKFMEGARRIIDRNFKEQLPDERARNILSVYLLQNTLGLGKLESLLADEQLEEIVINNSREPIWVYHKKNGWCKSNINLESEEQIYDYASTIARKIGRQINILNPTLDAHLPTGDRVNATLFPISHFGNTLTIRKFSKNPWTITTLIKSSTISVDVAALVWLCIQNELSLIVSGGTGSGKTSFLNAMAAFIPANQRVISIEDTRELTLPKFLHWVPMVVREANPEGKGEITMLDLMVNALRQRPDRILVGEIRRQREAEILFEAMHTGHSVYATLHADNTEQTISRLTNPPINIPPQMLDALSGVIVTFRHRRFNIRRILEFSEIQKKAEFNVLYRWTIKEGGEGFTDKIKQVSKMSRIAEQLSLYAGMDDHEIADNIAEKVSVLKWMVKQDYETVDQVGKIISHYYVDPDEVLEVVKKNGSWEFSE